MAKYIRKPLRIKRKKNILKAPVFWLAFLILVVAGTMVYFLVFFGKVQVKTIIVSGNEKVSTSDIEGIVNNGINKKILFLNSKSIFLANTKKISSKILETYPAIFSVSIAKRFFDTLVVEIAEKVPAAVFCKSDKTFDDCYYLDKNGIAFEKTENSPSKYLIVRQNAFEKDIVLGQAVVNGDMVEKLANAKNDLENNYQITLKEADIVSEDRLNITTSEGWKVYFNLKGDIGLQITKLKLLLYKELSKEARARIKYVDLRFGDRAYYK